MEAAHINNANQDVVEDSALELLSQKFSGEWRAIGRNLGHSDYVLDHLMMDIPQVTGRQQQIQFRMLKKWKEEKAHQATRERLADALTNSGRTDLAEELLNDNR